MYSPANLMIVVMFLSGNHTGSRRRVRGEFEIPRDNITRDILPTRVRDTASQSAELDRATFQKY